MDRTLVVALFFCVLAVCLATNDQNSDKNSGEPGAKLSMKKRGKEDEDDAKVEVVQDEKDESAKERKASDGLATEKKDIANEKVHGGTKKNEGHDETKDDDEDHDDEEHDDEDDEEEDEEHEEEEEVDPNAKIEIHDLFTPEDCKNKSKSGDLVVIHYSGWLDDGKLFDTTVEPSKAYMPFEFMLGTGTVIKGFEQGVLNMCKGQKRKIVIPPSLGYGKKGAGAIPGNTTLTYELEMFDIRQPPPQADMFSHIDTNGDKKLSRKEVSAYMKSQAAAHGMPVHDKKWKKHHKTVVANIFDHEDSDEDGSISHDEFSGPKMMYHDEF